MELFIAKTGFIETPINKKTIHTADALTINTLFNNTPSISYLNVIGSI